MLILPAQSRDCFLGDLELLLNTSLCSDVGGGSQGARVGGGASVPLESVDVAFQTLDSELESVCVALKLIVLPLQVLVRELGVVVLSSLVLDQELEITVLLALEAQGLLQGTRFKLDVVDLLTQEGFVLLKLRACSLQTLLVVLDALRQGPVVVDLQVHLVLLVLDFPHCFVGHLELVSQVVDVSLQCLDLCDVVLLFLLQLLDGKAGSRHVLLEVEAALVHPVVLLLHVPDGFLVPLILSAGVSVVLEDVLFLHL